MRVCVVTKWPLRGRSLFLSWNITRVSLWLLCNVHFVQSTQKDPPTDKTIRVWYKQFTETGCLCKQKAHMLTRVWHELEYRIDVCRVTCGAHIEYIYLSSPASPPPINFFTFPVAVNNSIKVGPLVFLL